MKHQILVFLFFVKIMGYAEVVFKHPAEMKLGEKPQSEAISFTGLFVLIVRIVILLFYIIRQINCKMPYPDLDNFAVAKYNI